MIAAYTDRRLYSESERLLEVTLRALKEIGEHATARQVFKYLVEKSKIEDGRASFHRYQDFVNAAHLAGLLDWMHLRDQTWRYFGAMTSSFEVWVERDSLVRQVAASVGNQVRIVSMRDRLLPLTVLHEAKMREPEWILILRDSTKQGQAIENQIVETLELFGSATKVDRIAPDVDEVDSMTPETLYRTLNLNVNRILTPTETSTS